MFRLRPIIFLITLLTYQLPVVVWAQSGSGAGAGGGSGSGSGGGSGSGAPNTLNNYLQNQTLMGLLESILEVIMIFAVPIVVFFIIYAGFQYVTARGDVGKVSNAHRALLYAVIGGVIILAAQVLIAVIGNTIDAF